jgi:hypothetical protein
VLKGSQYLQIARRILTLQSQVAVVRANSTNHFADAIFQRLLLSWMVSVDLYHHRDLKSISSSVPIEEKPDHPPVKSALFMARSENGDDAN